MLTPSTCSGSPASSFPGLRKAGRGAGNEATHSDRLSAQVSPVVSQASPLMASETSESCY